MCSVQWALLHTHILRHTHRVHWLNGPEGAPYLIPWFILQKTFFSFSSLFLLSLHLCLWGTPCQWEALMVDDTLIPQDRIYLLGDSHTEIHAPTQPLRKKRLMHRAHILPTETLKCKLRSVHTHAPHIHAVRTHTEHITSPCTWTPTHSLSYRCVPCGVLWYV